MSSNDAILNAGAFNSWSKSTAVSSKGDEKSVILIKESKYVGFGYFNLNYQITNYNILESLISKTISCQSYDKLIISYIKKNKVEKIINTENFK